MKKFNGKNIIFSAHCDDAVLSLGGIFLKGIMPNVHVVDIFATCAWSRDDLRVNSSQALTQLNQAEEVKVMKQLGYDLSLHDYPEALLRGYRKWNTRHIHQTDKVLLKEIYKEMRQYIRQAQRVLFPMAIGNHVDHILVHKLASLMIDELKELKTEIYFYEDVPYGWWINPTSRIDTIQKEYILEPEIIDINNVIEEKISLLKNYASQIDDEEIKRVREYAASIENKKYCERLWQVMN